jgi:integrase/recombinase XerC/integrase/recombinase XerD
VSEPAEWGAALRLLDRELQRRGAAERTRRAYGADVARLAAWARGQGLSEPAAVEPVHLRLYAAHLAGQRLAPATAAQAVASLRAFFRVLVEHGLARANPADELREMRPTQRFSRPLHAPDVALALDRSAATTPLELRDRALFELAYACGLRAEELVCLNCDGVDFEAERLRVEGRATPRRLVSAGEGALGAVAAYLERARPALVDPAVDEPALFLSKTGRRLSTSDVRRRLRSWARTARAAPGAYPSRRFVGSLHPENGGEAVGHRRTPHVYTRVDSARLRAAYERSHPRA